MKTLVLRDKINHKTSIHTDTHINKSVGTCWGFAIAFYKAEFIFLPHFFKGQWLLKGQNNLPFVWPCGLKVTFQTTEHKNKQNVKIFCIS